MRHPRRLSALILLAVFPISPSLALAQGPAKIPAGYTKATADANAGFEKIFFDTPTPETARRWLFQLTEEPHVAGTPAEKKAADWVQAKMKEFGLETEMVKLDVFLNHPKSVSLKMVEPRVEELSLREDNIPQEYQAKLKANLNNLPTNNLTTHNQHGNVHAIPKQPLNDIYRYSTHLL